MGTGGRTRILRHGTTRQRAEAILRDGPDVNFREPGGLEPAWGFSTAPLGNPDTVGIPEEYATRKAALFPNEGGPAILEIEVPEGIIKIATDVGGEVRFEPGSGLRELKEAWPTLLKRIL